MTTNKILLLYVLPLILSYILFLLERRFDKRHMSFLLTLCLIFLPILNILGIIFCIISLFISLQKNGNFSMEKIARKFFFEKTKED